MIKNVFDEFVCVYELNKLVIWVKIWIYILINYILDCCMIVMIIKEFNELNDYIIMFVNFFLLWYVMYWWYNNVLLIYFNFDLLWISFVNGFFCCL